MLDLTGTRTSPVRDMATLFLPPSFQIDPAKVADAAALSLDSGQIKLSIITFGDNDNGDCDQPGMSVWVEIEVGG